MGAAPPLRFVVPVWGEGYTRTFLDYCLPAQLSCGNIPALSYGNGNSYTICTTRADFDQIQNSPAYETLRRIIAVTIEFLDADLSSVNGEFPGAKYAVKSDCYRRALRHAAEHGEAVVLLNADIVLADGFVRTVTDRLARGTRVVEVTGPRGLRDPIGEALTSRYRGADGNSIVVGPIELSALWLKNIHPLMSMHFVDGGGGEPFHPSHLYWRVGEEGIIARCFHLYPIVVYPGAVTVDFSTTIDDDLVRNLGLSGADIYIANDSREMFCCELSPPEQYVGHMARRGDLRGYVAFYRSYNQADDIQNLEQEIIIAGQPALGPQWGPRREESARFVQQLKKSCRQAAIRQSLQSRWADVLSGTFSIARRVLPAPARAVLRRIRAMAIRK